MMNQHVPETVRIERWRTDNANWWTAGVAFVYAPDGSFETQFDTGRSTRFKQLKYPVGAVFTVRVITHDGAEQYDETFEFVVTADLDDVSRHWTGPGMQQADRGMFEYGVDVVGAVLRARVCHLGPEKAT